MAKNKGNDEGLDFLDVMLCNVEHNILTGFAPVALQFEKMALHIVAREEQLITSSYFVSLLRNTNFAFATHEGLCSKSQDEFKRAVKRLTMEEFWD